MPYYAGFKPTFLQAQVYMFFFRDRTFVSIEHLGAPIIFHQRVTPIHLRNVPILRDLIAPRHFHYPPPTRLSYLEQDTEAIPFVTRWSLPQQPAPPLKLMLPGNPLALYAASFSSRSEDPKQNVRRERDRIIHHKIISTIPEFPGWDENLASNSEADVKADLAPDKSIEELQKESIETLKKMKEEDQEPDLSPVGGFNEDRREV
eukprot:GEZU01039969.1.p1 GENE.GEZU01039969.1~~GEZU01039969.1.p1  ORF type:complete len:204 (+),score=29.39 GEZU01039969.1:190-801(+)